MSKNFRRISKVKIFRILKYSYVANKKLEKYLITKIKLRAVNVVIL